MARSFAKHRFQNSLDMIAARSMVPSAQSGTGNAWCIVDSPTLGRMSSLSRRTEGADKRCEEDKENPQPASGTLLTVPQPLPMANTAPLNVVKKIRRRGLISGAHLALPPSPLPLGPFPQPIPTPNTALTFTAEFDLSQNSFVFTPFETNTPRSTTSMSSKNSLLSPIPLNVDEGSSLPNSPAPSVPSRYSTLLSPRVIVSPDRRSWAGVADISSSDSSVSDSEEGTDSSPRSDPSTPVSDLFDSAPHSTHRRSASGSTAASSLIDLPSQISSAPAALARRSKEWPMFPHAPGSISGSEFDDDSFDLDKDLLSSPMGAFERAMWEETEPDVKRQSHAPWDARNSRLSAVPEGQEPTKSRFSTNTSLGAPSLVEGSLRRQMQRQINRALSAAFIFKR